MDRIIAPNSVDAAHADTAPVTGTPGYATDGNPATGVPATLWATYQYNAIQEELIAFLTAAGIGPDNTSNVQVLAACRALFAAIGGNAAQTFSVAPAEQATQAAQLSQTIIAAGPQCQLAYSGGNLVLSRFKGLYAYIPGSGIVTIPSGGVTLAPAALTTGTLYYIYLYLNSGTPTLTASTTAHATDANTGIEVMSGDNTKLLVGMERAASVTSWAGLCRSWRNDPGFSATTGLTANASTTSTTGYAEISAVLRTNFLIWAGEVALLSSDGSVANTGGTTNGTNTSLGVDGTTAIEAMNATTSAIASAGESMSLWVPKSGLAEGFHYVTLLGVVNGGTGTWSGNSASGSRTSVKVYIAPRK